jgi:hypothetical protein
MVHMWKKASVSFVSLVPVYKTPLSVIAEESEPNFCFHRYEMLRCDRLKVCVNGVLRLRHETKIENLTGSCR